MIADGIFGGFIKLKLKQLMQRIDETVVFHFGKDIEFSWLMPILASTRQI